MGTNVLPFTITREDLLRSKVVTPGWYTLTIRSVNQAPARTDGSTNTNIVGVIKGGPFDGVPIPRTFNEKAPGFAREFIEAVMRKNIEPGKFNMAMAEGQTVWAFVKNDTVKSRIVNQLEDFKPYTEGQTRPPV